MNQWEAGSDGRYSTKLSYDANGNILSLERNGLVTDSTDLAMDKLVYHYETINNNYKHNTNKLRWVDDEVASGAYGNDIDDQEADNYGYDESGNLVSDVAEGIQEIKWTVSGKVKEVIRISGNTNPDVEFKYDASGNRIAKIVKYAPDKADPVNWETTWYVRDATGNVLSIYTEKPGSFMLAEQNIYGSAREAVMKRYMELTTYNPIIQMYSRTIGLKHFEGRNHLGNVLTTFSDRKLNNNGSYLADIRASMDYYAFGMLQKGRSFNSGSSKYGFGGMEKDDEIYGSGNAYTAAFWEYDPRIGRRWNMDVVRYPWPSPYACFNNNPVYFKDPSGMEGEEGNKEVQKHSIAKGETLTGIAKQHNTSVETLMKWNPQIKDKDLIYAGDELTVSDPTRPAAHQKFESYPEVGKATGWSMRDQSGGETKITNGYELGRASMANYEVANFDGQILEKVKQDPEMVAFQETILSNVKSDPRYGKEAFYKTGSDVIGFGGKRWTSSSEDWGAANRNNPALHLSTYKVVASELTWALRNASVKYWVEVSPQGVIKIQFRLYDKLDLSPSKGRSEAYNNISSVTGFFYHTLGGGNKNLQTRATWSVTTK